MATPVLNAEIREATGKNRTRKIRKLGKIPGVVYSRGVDTKEIQFDEREVLKMLSKFGQNAKISLNLEGEKSFVIIKDLQRGVIDKKVMHIDLQTLSETEKIKMTMPIRLINREDVETSSQFVEMLLNEIEIQTFPRYLPDRVELDASKLKEKEFLTIADLNIGDDENIEITEEKDRLIASLTLAEDMVEEIEEIEEEVEEALEGEEVTEEETDEEVEAEETDEKTEE
ncbi:MAG: 50S ribosomal protein L25 [Natronincolaceae bacterium]|jgi:large subunit ribosomal protein L25|nr:50S ribosomal protein L25 [Bacillota bacterium]NLK91097.1 50S ribosomal protein L25 [Clostridiales bacterium]